MINMLLKTWIRWDEQNRIIMDWVRELWINTIPMWIIFMLVIERRLMCPSTIQSSTKQVRTLSQFFVYVQLLVPEDQTREGSPSKKRGPGYGRRPEGK
jgi:hypothetical protein